MIIIITLSLS